MYFNFTVYIRHLDVPTWKVVAEDESNARNLINNLLIGDDYTLEDLRFQLEGESNESRSYATSDF